MSPTEGHLPIYIPRSSLEPKPSSPRFYLTALEKLAVFHIIAILCRKSIVAKVIVLSYTQLPILKLPQATPTIIDDKENS